MGKQGRTQNGRMSGEGWTRAALQGFAGRRSKGQTEAGRCKVRLAVAGFQGKGCSQGYFQAPFSTKGAQ